VRQLTPVVSGFLDPNNEALHTVTRQQSRSPGKDFSGLMFPALSSGYQNALKNSLRPLQVLEGGADVARTLRRRDRGVISGRGAD
jgi:hypothetical protein